MLFAPGRADLCLSYANTLAWRGSPSPAEELASFADLLDWLGSVGAVDSPTGHELAAWARDHSGKAARLLVEAIAIREAIYRLFSASTSGYAGREHDLAALNRALAGAPPRRLIVRRNGGYAWAVPRRGPTAPVLLAAVLWSAGDFIVAGAHRRVRPCANDKCLWLFLDESKGGTRRWCDMTSCGNRAKARRHYLKSKAG